jgi:hypothetical protein
MMKMMKTAMMMMVIVMVCASEREEQSGIGVTARKALVVEGDSPMASSLFLDLLHVLCIIFFFSFNEDYALTCGGIEYFRIVSRILGAVRNKCSSDNDESSS